MRQHIEWEGYGKGKTRTQRSPAVHVLLELRDRRLRLADLRELHDAAALGARAVEQNLRELDLARRLEQLDQILVRRRPRELHAPQPQSISLHPHPSTNKNAKKRRKTTTRTLRTIICWLGSPSTNAPPPPPPYPASEPP
jgi:hypothetical protein